MDPISVYGISSGVSAIAGSRLTKAFGSFIASWIIKRRLKKRCHGLLVMKGVSTLCEKLTTSNVLYLDVDKLYQQLNQPISAEDMAKKNTPHNPVDDYLAYPIIKNHILNISGVFKGQIVLVSKSIDLLHAMPIYDASISFYAFSKTMEENVGNIIYNSQEEHHQAIITKFRAVNHLPKPQISYVSSMAELYEKVSEKYGSKQIEI